VDDEEDKKKSKKGKKGEEQHKPREEHPAGGAAAPEGKLEDDWVEVDERKKPREEEGDEQPEQVELRADRSWKGAHADASSQLEEDSVDSPLSSCTNSALTPKYLFIYLFICYNYT
jgi:hypothetical protein